MVPVLFYFFTVMFLFTCRPAAHAGEAAKTWTLPDTVPVVVPDTVPRPAEDTAAWWPKKDLHFTLMLPLYFGENLREDTAGAEPEIDPRSLSALHFYEGALLAREDLAREGITLDLPVIDIGGNDDARTLILLNYQMLKRGDLVIANFPPSACEAASSEASRIGLPLALTQYGNEALITGRPGVILMASPPFVQCRLMARYIARREPGVDHYLVSRTENRENELADAFASVLDTALADTAVIRIDDFEAVFPNLLSVIDTFAVSDLILPSSDESYVSSVLNRLDTLNIPLRITGLPTWENFETLRLGRFRNLTVRMFSSTWFDENRFMVPFRRRFIEKYRTDALFSAYQAYDFCTRTARLFARDARSFPDQLDQAFGDSGLMHFVTLPGGGRMNTRIEVLEYHDFELKKAQ